MLRAQNRELKPRKAFLIDFAKYLTELARLPTAQFIVMGDLNEVVGVDPSGFAKITTTFQLVDVQRHFHTLKDEVPTYARVSSRLDYVFCSTPLLSAVRACGVEPFNQHIFSDHRAIFVDWDELSLFGSEGSPLAPKSQRLLQATCYPSKVKYITELHAYCMQHRVFQRIARLETHPNPSKAERVDRDISRGMAMAESRCRSLGKDPWSVELK